MFSKSIIGKFVGSLFGYWVLGWPGAFVGFVLGHVFDKIHGFAALLKNGNRQPISAAETELIRQSFFKTTFTVMGHVAKSDGHVQKSQIALAESVMEQMSLTPEQREVAIQCFNNGKQSDFVLDKAVIDFRTSCQRSTDLYRIFLQVQLQAALADGQMAPEEEAVLLRVSTLLGFPEFVYRQIEMLVRVNMGLGDDHSKRYGGGSQSRRYRRPQQPSAGSALQDAYTIIGVSKEAGKSEVKRAYRKLISENHPDKLVSKGLPEEMIKMATSKTQEIQLAYDRIKEAKGWP